MSSPLLLADSVTGLGPQHAGAVLVTGSHGGLIAAEYAARARVRAVIFNDAGGGLGDAGIAGLDGLAAVGIPAATVSHNSARIGDAHDTLQAGIVSRVNTIAQAAGIEVAMRCEEAAARLAGAPEVAAPLPAATRIGAASSMPVSGIVLVEPAGRMPAVIALDSIGRVTDADAGGILVIGSHGALHGGDPASALPVNAVAAFFHDAGRGKDDAGTSRLPVLDARGIAAATVDYRTARIGDARSLWETGRISCVNRAMWSVGIVATMSLREAVGRLRAAASRVKMGSG